MNENYNQHKANATGKTYYQVTCEAFGCNLWAVDEDNARHIVYSFWPDLLGKYLTVKVIVEPEGKEVGCMRKVTEMQPFDRDVNKGNKWVEVEEFEDENE